MKELVEFLEEFISEQLIRIIISGARNAGEISKVRIRPVLLKGEIKYQCSETHGTKELHKNYDKRELIDRIEHWMAEDFRQLQLESQKGTGSVLVSKKGKMTVRYKRSRNTEGAGSVLSHNRKKKYILEEGRPVEFLVDLGVMTPEGKIVHSKYDKFRQINRFLEFIEDILPRLSREREVTILDFGCGKSYLTFAMYYYLKILKEYDVNIIGLDLKADVIMHCNELSEQYGYEKLRFLQGDIASYTGTDHVDMVVTLHACDTATDYALAKAVAWGAEVILSVPCCQHELNGQIRNEMLSPVFSYGILKERMAALITDGLRAQLLAEAGYDTQILEFIDMEHTPKNLLIRAVRNGKRTKKKELETCMQALHVTPTLKTLLDEQEAANHEENTD